ncbi:MAG TPA: 3D domain-containing protein [Acidimicrobiales bacterium]|nr:3D domain-containing protein [Acidimicrobiales bacterium]
MPTADTPTEDSKPGHPGPGRPTRRGLALVTAAATGVATFAGAAGVGADTGGDLPANANHGAHGASPVGELAAAVVRLASNPSNADGPGHHLDPVDLPAPAAAPAPTTAATVPPAAVVGHASVTNSDGADLGTFLVTCYALHGHTATGAPASSEGVAVDPRVIPLGTHLWVAGLGTRVADDTGGAIRGHHIDVWEPTTAQCDAFGRRWMDVRRAA